MEESQKNTGCEFKEQRFKGRLYVGTKLVRTISMQAPPRVGDEILYHDRYDLPQERWLVKRIAWQVTKQTDEWPPLKYP